MLWCHSSAESGGCADSSFSRHRRCWRDSAHNHEHKLMTLSLGEFLRHFLLHLLPKGFVRSDTSASSPTAGVPFSCRFAIDYSTQNSHRNPNQKPRQPSSRTHFGSVPNVAAPWWSSRDLLLPSSNSVLPHCSPEPLHETPNTISLTRCPPSPAGVARPCCPTPSSWLRTFARKLQSNQSSLRFA